MLIAHTWLNLIVAAVAGLLGLPVVILAILSLSSRRPANLGAIDGFLSDCTSKHSCVCSQATRANQRIAPIDFAGSPEEALAKLKTIVSQMSGTEIIIEKDRYLHIECTSRVFRFVDDLELLADPERHVIHCRSASRVGWLDFGVNRRRIERIRRAFAAGI